MAKNDIKLNDLCNLLANEVGAGATPASARKYLSALQSVILKELKLNKRIYFFNFGTFEIFDTGGYDRKMGDIVKGEGTVYRYIAIRSKISFKPSDVLLRAINENDFKPIKRVYKKKVTKEMLEERKILRRKEKESMEELVVNMLNKKKRDNE